MATPGRIIYIFILFCISIYADVKAVVDDNPIIAGESVEFEIEATGESVEFPKIAKIYDINVSTEGSQRFEWFEGNESVVKWTQVYTFTPKKSITIPAYRIMVDGKEEWTKPVFLQVKPNSGAGKNDFRIELKVSKTEAYAGEPVDVAVRFLEKREVPVMSVDFVPLKYEDFWVKRVGKPKRYSEGGYLVHEVKYLFFPQKAGELTIGPAQVKVATAEKVRDAFGFIVRRPKWSTVTSDPIKLFVKPLPEGIELVGDYRLEAKASPKEVEAGSPVTLAVRVEARGNIEDFDLPALRIDGVTVYADPPKIKQRYSGGDYGGSWERRYVLISDRSFTIPPFRIRFFDPVEKKVKEVSSEPVKIEVKGASGGEEKAGVYPPVQPESAKDSRFVLPLSGLWCLISFFAGIAAMQMLLFLKKRMKMGKGRSTVSHEQQMLQQLMPYISESKEAAQMAENLYANLFEGKAVRIDKKRFEKLMADLKG